MCNNIICSLIQLVQNTGHKSQVTGHCFTNTESIIDIHKS